MRRKSEAVDMGLDRTLAQASELAHTIGFEWMSFSGYMRLTGAEDVLRPGTTFWGALATSDRGRVRSGLEQASKTRTPVTLTCRLDTRSGPRSFLLEGEVVPGERVLAPRVIGVLVEVRPDAGEVSAEEAALDVLVERLAGALGDSPGLGPDADAAPSVRPLEAPGEAEA